MKAKNIRWILKNIPSKFFLLFWFFSLIIGFVYASSLFSGLPSIPGQTTNGSFTTRLANISSLVCPAKSFVKGFNTDYTPKCVPYNDPNPTLTTTSVPVPATPPAGEMPGGKFGTYFKNIINYCTGNGVLQGFTLQGKKVCVDALNRASIITPPLTSYGTSNVSYPTKPSAEPTVGGKFQSYFTQMFNPSASCTSIQGITGFQTDGTPICANIPVDGICGTSNGISSYTAPTTGLCSQGNVSWVSGSGPWSWSCMGLDGGATASCSANRIVDGWWSAWSSWGACSQACWPGTQTQSRSCTNPTPENGWVYCAGSSTNSQSCNMGACCVPNGSCSATPACETTAIGTDNCGNSCSRTGGSCACIPNGSCSAITPACGTTTTGTDNCGNSCSKTGWACACTPGIWSWCSASCEGGTQARTDSCGNTETRDCNTQACVLKCQASGAWTPALDYCSAMPVSGGGVSCIDNTTTGHGITGSYPDNWPWWMCENSSAGSYHVLTYNYWCNCTYQ